MWDAQCGMPQDAVPEEPLGQLYTRQSLLLVYVKPFPPSLHPSLGRELGHESSLKRLKHPRVISCLREKYTPFPSHVLCESHASRPPPLHAWATVGYSVTSPTISESLTSRRSSHIRSKGHRFYAAAQSVDSATLASHP